MQGKVVLPDGHADEDLVEPKIYVMKKMSSLNPDWNNMFQSHGNVSEDGSFEMTVPENCKLTVTAYSANAASKSMEVKIPKSEALGQEEDLGEIKLKPGVSVSGIVLDKDGQPVEGQIVQSQQTVRTSYMAFTVDGYAKSDSEGKFQLPPREGACDITLVERATIDGKEVKVEGEVLMAKPDKLTLKKGVAPKELEIREGRTWKIHGVISYEGEKPNLNYSSGSGHQKTVELDSDGRFEFEVVEGAVSYTHLTLPTICSV